jgi:triose/dihydroxyacetone kinase / FAD-AMP lyase (cyclizing)
VHLSKFKSAVNRSCENGVAAEPGITKSDTIVGDGDCGTTLKRGCESLLARLSDSKVSFTTSAVHNILEVAEVLENSMDGTSGAIYGLYFNGLAAALRKLPASTTDMDLEAWATVAAMALETLKQATPARVGDRTLIDALEPFVLGLKEGLHSAVLAARKGMESTKGMTPAFGRAVYVAEEGWEKVPDPGAEGVVALVEGLETGLR